MAGLGRRRFLQASGLGLLGASASGWLPAFAETLAADPKRRRHCVLLWMTGGASQTDTFDMKPGHANGGPFKEIETAVPGLRFSEHLPKLAQQADKLAIIRSLTTKEGDHDRGTYLMRTGHSPGGAVRFPTIGSLVSKELGRPEDTIPAYVCISPFQAFGMDAFLPGFLGPQFAPLTVGSTSQFQNSQPLAPDAFAELKVDDLGSPAKLTAADMETRLSVWKTLEDGFLKRHPTAAPTAHATVYRRAQELMRSSAARAFNLSEEPAAVREAYGRGRFGQGCLMARRLIEQGVSFVEVSLGEFGNNQFAWDTHQDNFNHVKRLSAELDAGWSTLIRELGERGLLESTTIVWMSEFGRTPKINPQAGRDHFPNAWTSVLAGGGIHGGAVYGRTSADAMTVEENPVAIGDVLATLVSALGISPEQENNSDQARPIKIAEGKPIKELLT